MAKELSRKERQELQRLRREAQILRSQLKSFQKSEPIDEEIDAKTNDHRRELQLISDSPTPTYFHFQSLKSDLKRTAIFSLLIIATLIGISVWRK